MFIARRTRHDVLRAVVAAGARDALGSSDALPRRIQQTIQHLTDRAVFAVEGIRVHGWISLSLLSMYTI